MKNLEALYKEVIKAQEISGVLKDKCKQYEEIAYKKLEELDKKILSYRQEIRQAHAMQEEDGDVMSDPTNSEVIEQWSSSLNEIESNIEEAQRRVQKIEYTMNAIRKGARKAMERYDRLKSEIASSVRSRKELKEAFEDERGIASEESLKVEVRSYAENSGKIKQLKESIQDTLEEIAAMEKAERSRLKNIMRAMEDFEKDKIEVDKWVAQLTEQLKYKRPTASYKTGYLYLKSKVNPQLVAIAENMMKTEIETKSKETKKVLHIQQEFLGLGKLWNNIKNMIGSFKGFKSVVKKLPDIK